MRERLVLIKRIVLSMVAVGLWLIWPPMTFGLETTQITINDVPFAVEIARTAEEKRQGLSFREHLPKKKGMLFVFDTPYQATFWMKDCFISLDILFFHQGRLVDYVDNAPPCRSTPEQCPRYQSNGLVDRVVELNAGDRQRYHLDKNSQLIIHHTPVEAKL